VLVSGSSCRRLLRNTTWRGNRRLLGPPPDDGVRLSVLEKEFKKRSQLLELWCTWDPHPALGRRIRTGWGEATYVHKNGRVIRWRGVLASRSDMGKCVEASKSPLLRRFPGNPGEWMAEGIFQHDDKRLFFSRAYIKKHNDRFHIDVDELSQSYYRKRVDELQVTWPRRGEWRWRLFVNSADSLARLNEWRAGKLDNGLWLVPGELWTDAEGLWYSSSWLDKTFGSPPGTNHRSLKFRDRGLLTRFKELPRGGKRRAVIVHHEDEVRPLLGVPGAPSAATPKRPRKKREREKHEEWDRRKKAGDSYQQIAMQWTDETGEETTEGAVKMAINRLRAKPQEGG
jgi:hypothetical protein